MLITWLPYPDFRQTAETLSDEHLMMQRWSVLEILEHMHSIDKTATVLPTVWHRTYLNDQAPIIRMWSGHIPQLCEFGMVCSEEWKIRNPGERAEEQLLDSFSWHMEASISDDTDLGKPSWWGDIDFHMSHQSALLLKDRLHYMKYFKSDYSGDLVWPVSSHAS